MRRHRHSSMEKNAQIFNETKYKQRRSQLNLVYQQLRKNFDRQVIKVVKQQSANGYNPLFDDQFIAHPRIDTTISTKKQLQSHEKVKVTLPRFYAQKFIINQSIYIHQKKEVNRLQITSQFRKMSFPKAIYANQQSNRSQRGKKLQQICKKVALDTQRKLNSQRDLVYTGKIIKSQRLLNIDPQLSPLPIKKQKPKQKKILMSDVLRQAQKREIQLEKYITNNHLLININTFQPKQKSQDQIKSESYKSQQIQPKSFQNQRNSLSPKKLKMKIPLPDKMLKIRKKIFNWKTVNFPLNKVQKVQIIKLLKNYLQINQITVPQMGFYKVYIGEGNNSLLIWKALKSKGYWTLVENIQDSPNLVWTQHPSRRFQQIQTSKNICLQLQQPRKLEFSTTIIDDEVNLFLKFKNNDFFETINKVYDKTISDKIIKEIITKFKGNRRISQYTALWESYIKIKGDKCNTQNIKSTQIHLHNHVNNSSELGNKKSLFHLMQLYAKIFNEDITQYIPLTLHLKEPINDKQIEQNQKLIRQKISDGPWIVKPGQGTNRGNGITVHTSMKTLLDQVSKKRIHKNGQAQTYIVQRYIMPMLYHQRKFDIRVWVLWNGEQLWWYNEGYLRTCSKQFTLKNLNKYIHLTNDAVQSCGEDYGKYQQANKLSFGQFQKYLQSLNSDSHYGPTIRYSTTFNKFIYPSMKQLGRKIFRMGSTVLDRVNHSFELFGLDYLIDNNNKVWLIEVNNNPCLQINCSLLARLIPNMIQNMLMIAVDPYFPPPEKKNYKQTQWNPDILKFELLYDASIDIQIQKYKYYGNINHD